MSKLTQAEVIPCPSHTEEGWCLFCGDNGVWFRCPVHRKRLPVSGYCNLCFSYYAVEQARAGVQKP